MRFQGFGRKIGFIVLAAVFPDWWLSDGEEDTEDSKTNSAKLTNKTNHEEK